MSLTYTSPLATYTQTITGEADKIWEGRIVFEAEPNNLSYQSRARFRVEVRARQGGVTGTWMNSNWYELNGIDQTPWHFNTVSPSPAPKIGEYVSLYFGVNVPIYISGPIVIRYKITQIESVPAVGWNRVLWGVKIKFALYDGVNTIDVGTAAVSQGSVTRAQR